MVGGGRVYMHVMRRARPIVATRSMTRGQLEEVDNQDLYISLQIAAEQKDSSKNNAYADVTMSC